MCNAYKLHTMFRKHPGWSPWVITSMLVTMQSKINPTLNVVAGNSFHFSCRIRKLEMSPTHLPRHPGRKVVHKKISYVELRVVVNYLPYQEIPYINQGWSPWTRASMLVIMPSK